MIVSLLLLFGNVLMYIGSQSHTTDDLIITPLVPGVNVELAHVPYLFIALLVSAVIHEAGHALAATTFVAALLPLLGFDSIRFDS